MGRCSDARERLLATAAKLFHERGYTAVSVSDICDAADLKKGSFYHFFDSKKTLALAALDGYAALNRVRMRAMVASGGTVRDRLERMFHGLYENYREHHAEHQGPPLGCPLGNLAAEMAGRDVEITAKLESIFTEWRQALTSLLDEGSAAGELHVADTEAVAESLVAFVEGAALMARTMSDPEFMRRMSDRALALLQPTFVPVSAPSTFASPKS